MFSVHNALTISKLQDFVTQGLGDSVFYPSLWEPIVNIFLRGIVILNIKIKINSNEIKRVTEKKTQD